MLPEANLGGTKPTKPTCRGEPCSLRHVFSHMAQAGIPIPRIFPTLPNGLGKMILHQLSFYELINGYFVSSTWRNFIDHDDELRSRIFLLPIRFTTSSNTHECEKFVADLWRKHSTKRVRNKGARNPIYSLNPGFFHRNEAFQSPHDASTLRDLPDVHPDQQQIIDELWGSMFITYPPSMRVEYFYMMPAGIWRPGLRSGEIVDRKGVTVGELRGRTVTYNSHVPSAK